MSANPIDLDARRHRADAKRQVEQDERDEAIAKAEALAEMNRELAVLREPVGSILVEGGTIGYQIASTREITVKYANKPNAPKGGWVKAWLAYPARREFSRIVFEPGAPDDGDAYNLWRGWSVTPSRNGLDITIFWDFVRETICASDENRYRFLRRWMAHAIQKPGEMPRVAVLLHSIEGTGKGTLHKWFDPLFGRHSFTATSLDNALGHFNAHLANALLVFANEAIWGGDKRLHGRMKALITDPTSDITQKHKDTITVGNYKRWIFASNADHPVPIERSDRRFAVFEVSTNRVGKHEFFDKLEALRLNGGIAALMRDLLAEDLSGFNPERDRPRDGLAAYKTQSASALEQWLQGTLEAAEIRRHDRNHDCYEPWGGYVLKNLVYDSYCGFTKSTKTGAESPTAFWSKLRAIGMLARRDRRLSPDDDGERPRAAFLADLGDARKAFAGYMGEVESERFWDGAPSTPPNPCRACEDSALAGSRYG